MLKEGRYSKIRSQEILVECLTLSTPRGRIITFTIGVLGLILLDINSLKLPNLCIWERLLGFCPAHGTTRALNSFFHLKWRQAIRYNPNVLATAPIIITIYILDLVSIAKNYLGVKKRRNIRDEV